MTEPWQFRWNELNGRLHDLAARDDPTFVGAVFDRSGSGVVIHRSTPTTGELSARYATLIREAGFGEPTFRQVPVSPADREAVTRVIVDADAELQALGITVWRIAAKGIGQTIVVSYEDIRGHGIPQLLLDDVSRFPTGTVEFQRVVGPTQVGA